MCNYVDVYYNEFITSSIPFMEATASKTEINQFSLYFSNLRMHLA